MMGRRQLGVTTVEFAIISTSLIIVLFGVIEIARVLFVWNTLSEVTRRGARVAAVCPVNHPAIGQVSIFADPTGSGTSSPVINGLTTANIGVDYLDDATNVIADPIADFSDIAFVRVSVNNFQHTLIIPLIPVTLNAPPFSTTVPIESLGYIPDLDVRQCYGT